MEAASMRIKIIKCSQPKFWYSDKVGQVFSVIDKSTRDYYININGNHNYSILVVDAVILNKKPLI